MLHVRRMSERLSVLKPMLIDDLESKPAVKLNDYFLAARIGEGSHGKVYLAIDCNTNTKWAAKAIKLSEHGRLGSGCSELEREIRLMRELSHPNILALHEVLRRRDTGMVYLIMEYAKFGTLKDKRLSEVQIASAFKQVIAGLKYLHGRGIVHQDLKPSNILLFADGVVKIGDFGIGHSFQSAEMVVGTPAYQAPEFFDDYEDLDPVKEDIWSLGVSMYEAFYGCLPFVGETVFEIATNVKNTPLEFGEGASPEFEDLLRHILCVDPEKRYTLDDILAHKFMDLAEDRVSVNGCTEAKMRMKSSTSMIEVKAEVCDRNCSFASVGGSFSWPGHPGNFGLRRV